FLKSRLPAAARNSSTGSNSRSLSPKEASEGPRPRSTTDFGAFPVIIKPPIMTLSPRSTRNRVEIFNDCAGAGVDVAVGVAVAVAVAVAVGVAVAVAVGVAVGVGWDEGPNAITIGDRDGKLPQTIFCVVSLPVVRSTSVPDSRCNMVNLLNAA